MAAGFFIKRYEGTPEFEESFFKGRVKRIEKTSPSPPPSPHWAEGFVVSSAEREG
jgi:hypothetical protein